ncbi:unnamed protein product [Cyprideis torosa]|uniref:Cyclin-dependent kinases regulatory subunit n=1 Tax=Cyprideis torosa TaxID=163714 RepID=A0A7R8ZJR6_9CRUS|nr:unnamed protein product [Cyprideis torosa]CAG0882895.1 unnamed protein product [Cyprideis torosa]
MHMLSSSKPPPPVRSLTSTMVVPFFERLDLMLTMPGAVIQAPRTTKIPSNKPLPKISLNQLSYSEKYDDGEFEYRHIHCPKEYSKKLKDLGLMSEEVWRAIGIQQSVGWEHYMIHEPEPHVLLFRRRMEKK